MRLIDDRGKILGLINIIDLVALGLILVVGFVGASRFLGWRPERHEPGDVAVRFTAEVSNVRQPTVNVVRVGDVIRDHITGGTLGTIVETEVIPYTTGVETADGRVVLAEVPDRYVIYVTLEGRAHDLGTALRAASHELRVGATVMLQSRMYTAQSTVLEIEVMDP